MKLINAFITRYKSDKVFPCGMAARHRNGTLCLYHLVNVGFAELNAVVGKLLARPV